MRSQGKKWIWPQRGKGSREKGFLINKAKTDVLRWSEMDKEIRLGQTNRTINCVYRNTDKGAKRNVNTIFSSL